MKKYSWIWYRWSEISSMFKSFQITSEFIPKCYFSKRIEKAFWNYQKLYHIQEEL